MSSGELLVDGLEGILSRIAGCETAIRAGCAAAAVEIAMMLEAYARETHTWEDRTGDTTSTTKGTVAETTEEFILVMLSAGMDYDVYLEGRFSGELGQREQHKWSWLWPAIDANRDKIRMMIRYHTRIYLEESLGGLA